VGGTIADLADIIAPVDVEAFFRECWESKPLHIRRAQAGYYDELITLRDLEALISDADLRFPAIQLARNGMYLAPEAYTWNIKFGSEFFNGVADLDAVNREYVAGASVALPAVHRVWPALRRLCEALESSLDHALHANIYITPGNAAGFTPHYDGHEVFILQIAGCKHWQVFEPHLPLPHRTQTFDPQGYVPPPPLMELDLEAGDLLYLPRGYVHTATTPAGFSAHVTLGVTVYTWVELVSELLQSCKTLPEFRRGLPPGFASGGAARAAMKDELIRLVDRLRDDCDYDALIDGFTRRAKARRAKPAARFRADVTVITPNSRFKVPEEVRFRVAAGSGGLVLEYGGNLLALPVQYRSTLEAICAKGVFCPRDLPGPLDADTRLQLVRCLHQEGFLTRVE
jgi:hypothetical protein